MILEGAYSARPELAHFFALRVLLKVDESVRRQRLRQREGQDFMTEWHKRWSAAEDHYFANIVPEASFDLVTEWQAQIP